MCSIWFIVKRFALKNVKINIFTLTLLHSDQFQKIDWFKSISRSFSSESVWDCSRSKILLVRNRRQKSELIVIWNRNLETTRLKWNCFEFNIDFNFQIDFLTSIAMSHAKFLATTLDDKINKIRHEKLVVAIVCCSWAVNMRAWLKMIKSLNYCSFSEFILAESTSFLWNNIEFNWAFVSLIELKFLIVFLILNCIVFVWLFDRRKDSEVVIWAKFRVNAVWLEYREFILNRNFRQVAFASSFTLMFLICRYCYE